MDKSLESILKGKVVIAGVGNILKADDAFGPALVQGLQGRTSAVLIDAGTAPESYTGRIAKEDPDTLLLVDAVHLGRKPGEYEVLDQDEIVKSGMTTHDISPRLLLEYLAKRTKARIYLLGVQPQTITLGGDMSPEVNKTLAEIIERIAACMKPI